MSIDELQTAIVHLSTEDLARFIHWFEEYVAEQWDRKIEDDVSAGRLEAAGKRADEDFEAGRCTTLT